MANRVDPDETPRSALFAQACLSAVLTVNTVLSICPKITGSRSEKNADLRRPISSTLFAQACLSEY